MSFNIAHAFAREQGRHVRRSDYSMISCPLEKHSTDERGGFTTRVRERHGGLQVHCFACGSKYDDRDITDEVLRRGIMAKAQEWRDRPFSDLATMPQVFDFQETYTQAETDEDVAAKIAKAVKMFEDASEDIEPVQRYLASRGISLPLNEHSRFARDKYNRHKGWWYMRVLNSEGEHTATCTKAFDLRSYKRWPDGEFNRKIEGRMQDGVIPLFEWGEVIGLAEGPESALSAATIFGMPVQCVHGLRYHDINFPECVKHIVLFADNGERGAEAAETGEAALKKKGLEVTVLFPDPQYGDFNDKLKSETTIDTE